MLNKKFLLFVLGAFFAGAVFFVFQFSSDLQKELKWEKRESAERTIPIERAQWEWKMLRNPATNKIPANIRERELNFVKSIPSAEQQKLRKNNSPAQTLTLSNWSSIGPDNIGGRTRALAFDVSDNSNNTILAGGVSGGMWKTTDGGTSWVRTTTKTQLASVSCLAQDKRTGKQSTWYYGTGEVIGNSASDASSSAPYRGNGIFKSTNGGNTWAQLAATVNNSITTDAPFNYVWRVATDPSNASQDEVYAATTGGIMRSLDGGTTWQAVLGDSLFVQYSDIIVNSDGAVYATLSSNAAGKGIWRSATGNKGDWTNITPSGWPSTYTRIVLAAAPLNENIVYFFAATPGSGKGGNSLWKYTYPNSGTGAGDANWADRSAGLPSSFSLQGSYDQLIAVKPDDTDFVIIGGVDLLRSTNGFQDNSTNKIIGGTDNSTPTGDYSGHFPDQHKVAFKPGSPNVMLSANDGGVWRTDDVTAATVSWTELNNGYVTTQYYAIAIDNGSTSQIVTGGMQDRGNWFINPANNHHAFTMDDGGFDGTFDAIADNGAFYYSASQNGGLNRANFDASGNKTNSVDITPDNASGQMFVSPYILDLANTNIMYYLAGGSIWRSTGVSTATSSSGWTELQNSKLNSATITAIGVSQANSAHVVYFGTDGGNVYRLDGADSGDPAKVDVTGSGFPSNGYVNCIAVDKANSNNAIVVFSNYGVISLFYTNDGGTNWTNISGDLEQNADGSGDGPSCRWASIYNNGGGQTVYFVSTSTGVYSTTTLNGTSTQWAQEGASTIGNVVCPMVLTRDGDGFVAVGTHGNGAFTSNVVTSIENNNVVTPTSYVLSQNYPNPFNPSTKIKFSIPSSGNVKITVYDNLGREVAKVLDEQLAAGQYTQNFDASKLSSGVYFYKISAGNFIQTKKMILMK